MERLAHEFHGRVGGNQDGGQESVELSDELERLESRKPRHVHVEEGEMDRLVLDDFDGLLAVGRENGTKALFLDDFTERFTHSAIIVGDEDRIWLNGRRHIRLAHPLVLSGSAWPGSDSSTSK
jgi:hypothetical protein